jgi:hypothetical protein
MATQQGAENMTETTASKIAQLSAYEAMQQADQTAVEVDQDWDAGVTVYTFEDGSRLRVQDIDVSVVD